MVYQHYNVTNLHFISDETTHNYGVGKMVPGLTQIYQDLGYLPPDTEFNPGKYGEKTYEDATWEEFDQLEFIKHETESDGMLGLLETNFVSTGWVYIPNSCKKE